MLTCSRPGSTTNRKIHRDEPQRLATGVLRVVNEIVGIGYPRDEWKVYMVRGLQVRRNRQAKVSSGLLIRRAFICRRTGMDGAGMWQRASCWSAC